MNSAAPAAIHLDDKFEQFNDLWSPRIVAQINDYHVKLAKVQGEFVWHQHDETDELFLVMRGSLRIEFRDGAVTLNAGDLYVVPKGVEHRPVAAEECRLLLLEPAGTVNTGNVTSALTAANDAWV